MTKEIFTTLIENKLYLQLFLISVSSVIFTFILFKFGFMTLKVKVGFRDIFPLALTMSLFNFFMHQYLPMAVFATAEITLSAALLVIAGKVKILEGCWTSLLMYVSSNLGPVIIISILFFIDRGILNSLLYTTTGYIFGPLIEALIAAAGIILLTKKPNVSLIPPIISKRIDFYDVLALITYGAMAFLLFFSSIQLYDGLKNGSRDTLVNMTLYFTSAVIIVCGHISIVNALKKRFENQLFKLEEEKTKLEKEKAELEKREAILQQEKDAIAQEKALLEQDKTNLEIDKTDLLNTIQELKDSPGNVESIPVHQFQDLLTETIYKIQTLNKSVHSMGKQQTSSALTDNEKRIPSDLTSQERMILKGLGNGLSYKEIGVMVDAAEGTVKNWAGTLMKKLGLKNQLQLAAYAGEHGLIDKAEKDDKNS